MTLTRDGRTADPECVSVMDSEAKATAYTASVKRASRPVLTSLRERELKGGHRLLRWDLRPIQCERPAGVAGLRLRLLWFVRLGTIVVLWRRPVVLTILDDNHRFFRRRPLVLVFSLRKRANRSDDQDRQHHDLSYQPHHFYRCLLMQLRAWEGERDAPSRKAAI
jgi:hypothetical protein